MHAVELPDLRGQPARGLAVGAVLQQPLEDRSQLVGARLLPDDLARARSATARPTIGWSSIGCIGMSTIGRPWARARIVVAWPPWPTTRETCGISSSCGT